MNRAPTHYEVCSQSHPDRKYSVRLTGDAWTCNCAHHINAQRDCIHILAVRFRGNMREALAPLAERPLCERCNSPNVVASGKRHNESGSVTRWLCKACGRRFTGADGFKKRRADPEKIALALDLYFRGLSLRKVAEHLAQAYGLKVNPTTIYRWVTHYSALAARWMDEQQARTGERWHVDETVVNVNGEHRYFWNVMDSDTRFLLATHISKNRDIDNTRAPLKKAKKATPDRPSQVFTDGMQSYREAVRKELGGGWHPKASNPHRRVPSIRAAESNNRIERLHGTQRERTKVMRAYDNDKGAAALGEGQRVHYNMVRSHMALDKTPAEAAGMEPLDGFKWLAILARAAQNDMGK